MRTAIIAAACAATVAKRLLAADQNAGRKLWSIPAETGIAAGA